MRLTDEDLRKLIRDVPDFPQSGIIFKDITPLLADKVMFKGVVEQVCSHWLDRPPDIVTAIEARGFIPGGAVALGLSAGFVPIRKPGKLPWKTVSQDYQLWMMCSPPVAPPPPRLSSSGSSVGSCSVCTFSSS